MHYACLLKSKSHPRKQYVGSTRDLRLRFKAHNESRSPHTAKFSPLASHRLLRLCRRKDRDRIGKISQVRFGTRIHQPALLCRILPMYLWRRTAERHWVKAHEDLLQAHAHGQLVIVRRPERKRLELEIVCRSRSDSSALLKEFGGRIEALPRNWLERFARGDAKRIEIGKRLMVVRSTNELQRCSVRCPQRSSRHRARPDTLRTAHPTAHTIKPALLVIPASLAFGTGEHATTAMSLRFLEQLTRRWKRGWSLVDLGTGSGFLPWRQNVSVPVPSEVSITIPRRFRWQSQTPD